MYKKLIYSKSQGLRLETVAEQEENIEVHYSGINYKDALGVTGTSPIFKTDPLVPGIDFSGVLISGENKGQMVIGQGAGFGEIFDGGYTQKLSAQENLLVALPDGLSLKESMVLGTAGFTAGLAVYRLLQNDQNVEKGPILVSGATGGVGSFAIQILSQLGFEVHALTHRPQFKEQLLSLGASKVLNFEETFGGSKVRPLEKAKWAGLVDNLGGDFLAEALPQVSLWGNIASIGLAKGSRFEATVMPFILRGVSLLGVSSANCPHHLRTEIWNKLSTDWKPKKIESLVQASIGLDQVLEESQKILDHKSKNGRTLVNVKGS